MDVDLESQTIKTMLVTPYGHLPLLCQGEHIMSPTRQTYVTVRYQTRNLLLAKQTHFPLDYPGRIPDFLPHSLMLYQEVKAIPVNLCVTVFSFNPPLQPSILDKQSSVGLIVPVHIGLNILKIYNT